MRQLIHQGVLVPAPYEPRGLSITLRGQSIKLTPLQEEMAVKFVQKFGTPYVEDAKFGQNFMKDFTKALSIKGTVRQEEVDWKEVAQWVDAERNRKATMSKEERKAIAVERKSVRERNKERYGYATVDGQKTPLANYVVEPPSIYMGRGKHPLRGRWKPAIIEKNVTLNLSPDAPMPPGQWAGRVWHPNELWVAKWTDKLSKKVKYIWFHDTSPMKQERAQDKFELAKQLEERIDEVRQHILAGLSSKDEKRRKAAAVAYLIDTFHIRVGDEEETEAGTVGATSLRREHIKLHPDPPAVELDFLGKDSIRFDRTLPVSQEAYDDLKSFSSNGNHLFEGVRSEDVRDFLSEVMPKLSPKVFRTYHATRLFKQELEKASIRVTANPEAKKLVLIRANAAVAQLMNHQRTPPKSWKATYDKRLATLQALKTKSTKSAQKRKKNLKLRLEEMRMSKTWNLGTSLRNYIDPRVAVEFCGQVHYDWQQYYPKSLVSKFSWASDDSAKQSNLPAAAANVKPKTVKKPAPEALERS